MMGEFPPKRLEFTDDESQADAVLVNTCCFIGDAKEESVNTILEMAELKKKELSKLFWLPDAWQSGISRRF